jgi:hypothetical protein
MRPMLIAFAATAVVAAPAAAQDREADALRGAAGAIEQAAPAIDRATDAMLNLDIGPLMDAARPYGPRVRHHRTLRDIARRDDPYFERRMRDRIYGASARTSRTLDALAASMPALRQSLYQMEANVRSAMRGVPAYEPRPYGAAPDRGPPPPRARPGDEDDDWGYDGPDAPEGPGGEPDGE